MAHNLEYDRSTKSSLLHENDLDNIDLETYLDEIIDDTNSNSFKTENFTEIIAKFRNDVIYSNDEHIRLKIVHLMEVKSNGCNLFSCFFKRACTAKILLNTERF